MEFCADFETNTTEEDCRVWAWGVAAVTDSPESTFEYGNDFAGWLAYARTHAGRYWFHNLAFDGRFVIWNLLDKGYKWVREKPQANEFSTLISKMGKFYSIVIGNESGQITLADSYKKIPMKVSAVAKAYKLDMAKGELNYDTVRPVGHVVTAEELDYLRRDVLIMAQAMNKRLDMGTKLTTGSDCLANFKELIGKQQWDKYFPTINAIMDSEIRKAYRGGFVYANPKYKGKEVGKGFRLDVNSLYPWAMRDKLMPFGRPSRGTGEPKATEQYPLWVAEVQFTAKLKPGKIPTLQMRNSSFYANREYIAETVEPVTLWVCSVDWALMNDMYDIEVYNWGGHYKFRGAHGIFDDYVDFGMEKKANATDPGERLNFKLWLNNLYGKFGQKMDCTGKKPVMDAEGVVHYVDDIPETRDSVYIPVAVFVTAYAREKTVRAAAEFGDRFLYSDTDSIHALGSPSDIPADIEVHPKKLGAWKMEAEFTRAKFLRCKTYAEDVGGVVEYVCAGMSDGLKSVMRFEDFAPGFTTDERKGKVHPRYLDKKLWKLNPKNVRGGVILVPVPFTIAA